MQSLSKEKKEKKNIISTIPSESGRPSFSQIFHSRELPHPRPQGYPVFLNVFPLTKWIGGSGDEDGAASDQETL